jgi:phosphatidylglycerol:prolipoprotein diacylglycerol transferase
MIFGFIGGRGFHIFYEAWDFYSARPLDILKVWQGGFVFYGGFLSALIASFIYLKWKKISFGKWADLFAPVAAVGYAVGRIGCFLNGCCYGKLCDLPWAVQFTLPGQIEGHRHPTQLYSTLWDLSIFIILVLIERKPKWLRTKVSFINKHKGSLFFFWLLFHSIGRFWIEQLRDDLRGANYFQLSIASWLSIGFIILSLSFFATQLMNNPTVSNQKKK